MLRYNAILSSPSRKFSHAFSNTSLRIAPIPAQRNLQFIEGGAMLLINRFGGIAVSPKFISNNSGFRLVAPNESAITALSNTATVDPHLGTPANVYTSLILKRYISTFDNDIGEITQHDADASTTPIDLHSHRDAERDFYTKLQNKSQNCYNDEREQNAVSIISTSGESIDAYILLERNSTEFSHHSAKKDISVNVQQKMSSHRQSNRERRHQFHIKDKVQKTSASTEQSLKKRQQQQHLNTNDTTVVTIKTLKNRERQRRFYEKRKMKANTEAKQACKTISQDNDILIVPADPLSKSTVSQLNQETSVNSQNFGSIGYMDNDFAPPVKKMKENVFSNEMVSVDGLEKIYILKNKYTETWTIDSERICSPKKFSILVYTICEKLRIHITERLQHMCSLIILGSDLNLVNEFKNDAIFLPLSRETKYRLKRMDKISEINTIPYYNGRLFSGTIDVTFRGFKVALNTKIVKPVIKVLNVTVNIDDIA